MYYILKHKETGVYYSYISDNNISNAIRYDDKDSKVINSIRRMTTDPEFNWNLIPYEQESRKIKLKNIHGIYFKK